MVEACRAEIFADVLDGIGEGFSDAAGRTIGVQKLRTISDRPQGEERLDAGGGPGTRGIIRNEREIAEAEVLAEAFVISEEKRFVFLSGPPSEPPNSLR